MVAGLGDWIAILGENWIAILEGDWISILGGVWIAKPGGVWGLGGSDGISMQPTTPESREVTCSIRFRESWCEVTAKFLLDAFRFYQDIVQVYFSFLFIQLALLYPVANEFPLRFA